MCRRMARLFGQQGAALLARPPMVAPMGNMSRSCAACVEVGVAGIYFGRASGSAGGRGEGVLSGGLRVVRTLAQRVHRETTEAVVLGGGGAGGAIVPWGRHAVGRSGRVGGRARAHSAIAWRSVGDDERARVAEVGPRREPRQCGEGISCAVDGRFRHAPRAPGGLRGDSWPSRRSVRGPLTDRGGRCPILVHGRGSPALVTGMDCHPGLVCGCLLRRMLGRSGLNRGCL